MTPSKIQQKSYSVIITKTKYSKQCLKAVSEYCTFHTEQ